MWTRAIFDRYSIIGGAEIQDAAAKLQKRHKSSLGTILGTAASDEHEAVEQAKGKNTGNH